MRDIGQSAWASSTASYPSKSLHSKLKQRRNKCCQFTVSSSPVAERSGSQQPPAPVPVERTRSAHAQNRSTLVQKSKELILMTYCHHITAAIYTIVSD